MHTLITYINTMTSYCLLYIVSLFWILLNMSIPGSFCFNHPCVPGDAAAADYISASQQYLWLIALWTEFKLSLWNHSLGQPLAAGQVIIIKLISANHDSFYMKCLGCKRFIMFGLAAVIYPSSNWGGYFHCPHGWDSCIGDVIGGLTRIISTLWRGNLPRLVLHGSWRWHARMVLLDGQLSYTFPVHEKEKVNNCAAIQ